MIKWTQIFTTGAALGAFSLATNGAQLVLGTDLTKIYSSDDGGVTWVLRDGPAATGFVNFLFWAPGLGLYLDLGRTTAGGGYIKTSPDGYVWTPRTVPATDSYNSVATDGTNYFALGGYSLGVFKFITSTNGTVWSSGSHSAAYNQSGIAYGAGLWVTCGDNGSIYTSPDGSTWTLQPTTTTETLYNAHYANGIFVVVGVDGAILTSVDGLNWDNRSLAAPTYYELDFVFYSSTYDLWFATGGDWDNQSKIVFSADNGVTWQEHTTALKFGVVAQMVEIGQNLFMAAYEAGDSNPHGGVVCGTNTATFSQIYEPAALESVYAVASTTTLPALFVGGANTRILSSFGGYTLTEEYSSGTVDDEISHIIEGLDKYIAVGGNGQTSPVILTAPTGDPSVWTAQASPVATAYLFSVAYNGNSGSPVYLAIGQAEPSPPTLVPTMLTSTDGVVWTVPTLPDVAKIPYGVIWDGTQWMVVGQTGKLWSSTDLSSWSSIATGTTTNLTAIAYNGVEYLLGGDNGLLLAGTPGNWRTITTGISGMGFNHIIWDSARSVWLAVGGDWSNQGFLLESAIDTPDFIFKTLFPQTLNRIDTFSGSYYATLVVSGSGISGGLLIGGVLEADSCPYWDILGNAGLVPFNFVGTTDDQDLVVKRNNVLSLRVSVGGALAFTGDVTTGVVPVSGGGVRMMWIPQKGAFRAGQAETTSWDAANVGNYSLGFGFGTRAIGVGSFASGYRTFAEGDYSVSLTDDGTASDPASWAGLATETGEASFVEGLGNGTTGTLAAHSANIGFTNGDFAHAEGDSARANATGAHAEGYASLVEADYGHVESDSSYVGAYAGHAEGIAQITQTTASWAHAENLSEASNAGPEDGLAYHNEGPGNQSVGASGNYSHSEGTGAAWTTASSTFGSAARTYSIASWAHSAAPIPGAGSPTPSFGSSQFSMLALLTQTANDTPKEMSITNIPDYLVLEDNKTYAVHVIVVGRNTGDDSEFAMYDMTFCCTRGANAAATSVNGPAVSVIYEAIGGWDVTYSADTSNGRFVIMVTGENAKTINWVAYCRVTETMNL